MEIAFKTQKMKVWNEKPEKYAVCIHIH